MKLIKLTQDRWAMVDDEDYDYLSQWKWYTKKGKSETWYACRNLSIAEGQPNVTIRMHRVILNVPQGLEVDHINNCGLDNRRGNLRECTRSQNMRNSRSHKNSSSRFKGVSWHKRDKVWQANITIHTGLIHIGSFDTEKDAAIAYNEKAVELFRDFARLNQFGLAVGRRESKAVAE